MDLHIGLCCGFPAFVVRLYRFVLNRQARLTKRAATGDLEKVAEPMHVVSLDLLWVLVHGAHIHCEPFIL